jgi:thiamine kinase-like enzyme
MSENHIERVAEYLRNLAWTETPGKITYWRKYGQNWLYRVDVSGIPTYVFKLYRADNWHNNRREALALVKLQELGFANAPHLIYANAGVKEFDGRCLLIYRYSEGEKLTPATLYRERIDQLALLLERLYAYSPSAEVLGLGKPQTIVRYWQETEQALRAARVEPLYQPLMPELYRLACEHVVSSGLLVENRLALVHGDLDLANFILSSTGSLSLVDWEQFGAGSPVIDLAWMLFLNRFAFTSSQKEAVLERLPMYRTQILQFYPLLQLRYLVSILQGAEQWKIKPGNPPIYAPQAQEIRQYWLSEAIRSLKTDFESFRGEQGLKLLEKTLTPMPIVSEQATPKSPAFSLRKHPPGLYLSFLNGAYDGLSRLLPTPDRFDALEFTIGRQEGNDIVLGYDHLLSRQHARLTVALSEADRWQCWLEDTDSQNGTYLAENKLGKGSWAVQIGQIFRVGLSLLRLDEQPQSFDEAMPITEFANAALINSLDVHSRHYLRQAQALALQWGAGWLGVEHLFLVLVAEEKKLTGTLWKKYQIKPLEVETKLKAGAVANSRNVGHTGNLPLTPRLQRVLARAEQLRAIAAESSRNKSFVPLLHRYLLSAILEDQNSLPSFGLTKNGLAKK